MSDPCDCWACTRCGRQILDGAVIVGWCTRKRGHFGEHRETIEREDNP